jgi:hypothetical protein
VRTLNFGHASKEIAKTKIFKFFVAKKIFLAILFHIFFHKEGRMSISSSTSFSGKMGVGGSTADLRGALVDPEKNKNITPDSTSSKTGASVTLTDVNRSGTVANVNKTIDVAKAKEKIADQTDSSASSNETSSSFDRSLLKNLAAKGDDIV